MRLTRRQLVGGAAATALGAAGIYELADRLGSAPARVSAGPPPPEQHLLGGIRAVMDNDVEVLVPPLHHQVVTATLRVDETPAALGDARESLEQALTGLAGRYDETPAGLGVTVAWGLPYFDRYVQGQAARHLPVDRRASATRRQEVRVLEDSIRFPTDPDPMLLESNDVAVLLRSDSLDNIACGATAIFDELSGLFDVTSIRKGFVGGGFDGGPGLPKQMALAAGIPGAELIPHGAELFLGFTSTQKAGLGPSKIANIETLGYADLGRSEYFAGGTHASLHLFEDLAAWYQIFDFQDRVDTPSGRSFMFRATHRRSRKGRRTCNRERTYVRTTLGSGRSGIRARFSRCRGSRTTSPAPTARCIRRERLCLSAPTSTRSTTRLLDHPRGPGQFSDEPAAGLHFVVFNPTSDDFRRMRLAMDGVMPHGAPLEFETGSTGRGFNSILATTHRQNFLVPPRAHRSFPLSELRD